MSQEKKAVGPTLPSSLRNFLTVTEADGAPRRGVVKPSPLLNRMKEFLPQMAAANEALQHAGPGQSAVQMEKIEGKHPSQGDQATELGSVVDMDLYVDEGLGKLVGTTFEVEDDGEAEEESDGDPKSESTPPLIEVIPEDSESLAKSRGGAASDKNKSWRDVE